MRTIVLTAILLACGNELCASPFRIDGDNLFYDTTITEDDSIAYGHEEELLELLKKNKGIKTINLTSGGGMVEPSQDMAEIIIDAELDTHVEFECSSACVTIFLAGLNRTLELGGKLGFHKSFWGADNIQQYYETQKEAKEWGSPFEFASWLYDDTQSELFAEFEYLLERGVSPRFAIETLKAEADGMWYPRRKQLIEAGVLTE